MPNAARLIAALSLAILAFIVTRQIMALDPERTSYGNFLLINLALGLATGWVVMGPRGGRGLTAAINNGLTGAAALLFWGLFVQSCYEMFQQASRNRFGGPFEALLAIFEIGAEYALKIATGPIILTLLVGGVLAGLATEYAARNWR